MDHSPIPPASSAASDRANSFPWPPLLLLGAFAGAVIFGATYPMPWIGIDDWPAQWVGRGFGIAGVGLIVWAMIELRRHKTTILPDGTASTLVTSGPFFRFRNPIYLGEVLIMLALAEITKNIWFVPFAGLFAVLVTKLQIEAEERHLEARFGDQYRAYVARSGRWL
jgi:protein-S-isoprenylcysteine O-methyltransferase Ste14